MEGSLWWAALGLMLVLEGVLPFVAPRLWRDSFQRLTALRDGQIRFFGLLVIAVGAVLLLVLG